MTRPKMAHNNDISADQIEQTDSTKPSSVHTKRKMPFWFKISIAFFLLALSAVTAGIVFTERLVGVVERQLEAIQHKEVRKAYSYTSKDFQSAMSFDQFVHFLESHPAFFTNHFSHFNQRSIKHDIGILGGNLNSNDHIKTPVEYRLIKEDNKWKILSIHFISSEERIPSVNNINNESIFLVPSKS